MREKSFRAKPSGGQPNGCGTVEVFVRQPGCLTTARICFLTQFTPIKICIWWTAATSGCTPIPFWSGCSTIWCTHRQVCSHSFTSVRNYVALSVPECEPRVEPKRLVPNLDFPPKNYLLGHCCPTSTFPQVRAFFENLCVATHIGCDYMRTISLWKMNLFGGTEETLKGV